MRSTRPGVVVVTGASAGVGRATAAAFAKRGWKVGLLARGEAGLTGAAAEAERLGGVGLPIPTDVAHADEVEAAALRVEAELGAIDVWVNDAMTTVFAPFHEISAEEYRRATEVTYLGAVWGTMSALRRMRPRDRGTIVQVGSALSYRAIPLQAPYCGAKHAMRGFTDSIRCELLHDRSKVHITMVQLPAMNTPQFTWCKAKLPNHPQPVPPIFHPEVAAEAIYWASRQRRREVFVGGNTVIITWGNKFLPQVGDQYLAKTGYDGQQTEESIDPDRPSNLFEPVDTGRDFGAHGEFGAEGKSRSWQLEFTKRRAPILGAMALLTAGLFSLILLL